jgi:hypothetical protein
MQDFGVDRVASPERVGAADWLSTFTSIVIAYPL